MAHTPPPVLALDIGGTKLAVAVVTPDGQPHGWLVEPTRRYEGPDSVIQRLFDLGHRAIATAALGVPIGAVGISCGGPLDPDEGVLQSPPHLPGWVDVPLGKLTSDAFDVPFALENDATAAARAEFLHGAGHGTRTMLYLTVSTGVGGGAVVNGSLHRGAAGNGGEFGHVIVHQHGRPCTCGRRGCVEAYASGTAIADRAHEALAADPDTASALGGRPDLTAADVSAAARAGDPLATRVWAETTHALGSAVTDLVNVFEPEMVVLGGGVTRAGAMLIEPVRAMVARDAMGPAARAVHIELARLQEAVCVVGAGAAALDVVSGVARV